MLSRMEDVCKPLATPTPRELEVDSKVNALPTCDVVLSSPVVGRPDNPVMDDAALGTVESGSLFPTMDGSALLSTPNELSNDDIGSTNWFAELSFDAVRVGGGGENEAGTVTEVCCALIDGTNSAASAEGFLGAGFGAKVGTNSLAVARIVPIGFVST